MTFTEEFLIKFLETVAEPAFLFLLALFCLIIFAINKSIKQFKFGRLHLERFRDLQKNDYMVTKLEITNIKGKKIKKPYKMTHGTHEFRCAATYSDGTKDKNYNAYWLCWPKGSNIDGSEVFGISKKSAVTLTSAINHEQYTELSCWVFPPQKKMNYPNPYDSTGLVY